MIVYWKSHRRRPVQVRSFRGLSDRQATIPAGWCSRCGREIFLPGKEFCPDCIRKER